MSDRVSDRQPILLSRSATDDSRILREWSVGRRIQRGFWGVAPDFEAIRNGTAPAKVDRSFKLGGRPDRVGSAPRTVRSMSPGRISRDSRRSGHDRHGSDGPPSGPYIQGCLILSASGSGTGSGCTRPVPVPDPEAKWVDQRGQAPVGSDRSQSPLVDPK